MKEINEPSRLQLLEILKSISPVVMDPTMTSDMGMECTFATKDGIVYPNPGMFLFSDGYWPVRKLSPNYDGYVKGMSIFSLNTGEEELIFKDVVELENTITQMFDIDTLWEEMTDDELINWQEEISADGISIISMSKMMNESDAED